MNKKQAFLTGLLAVLIILFIYELAIITVHKQYPFTADWEFCEKNGYNYDGHYLEYENLGYGRIKCQKYFVEGCEEEYFNVTRDWTGSLNKMDVLVGVSE